MKLLGIVCLLVWIGGGPGPQIAAIAQSKEKPAPGTDSSVIVHVYYFHTTFRCATCLEMEKWTDEIIRKKFSPQLKAGILSLQSLNFDEEKNFDFLNRYRLTRPTVVLAKIQKGQEIAWNELEQIWEFISDEAKFKKYIETELSKFLRTQQKEPESKKNSKF